MLFTITSRLLDGMPNVDRCYRRDTVTADRNTVEEGRPIGNNATGRDFDTIGFFVFPTDNAACMIRINISASQFKEQP